jgi:hypothetical protein
VDEDVLLMGSQVCGCNSVEREDATTERALQYNFHHTSGGQQTVEIALAMTSINRFSKATDWKKIEAAARAVLRKGEWSETAIIRLLSSCFEYYQSHNFALVNTEGLQAAVLTGDR